MRVTNLIPLYPLKELLAQKLGVFFCRHKIYLFLPSYNFFYGILYSKTNTSHMYKTSNVKNMLHVKIKDIIEQLNAEKKDDKKN